MTVGPDQTSLGDAEGNLRPAVARELMEQSMVEARTLAAQAGPRVPRNRRNVPIPVRPPLIEQPAPSVGGPSRALLAIGAIMFGALGFALGAWTMSRAHHSGDRVPEHAATVPPGRINGENVNLRSGPGVGFPVLARLQHDEPVQFGEQRLGWYAVSTSSGASGWVFGAFIRGQGTTGGGPALVARHLTQRSGGSPITLRPGDKVFCVDGDGGLRTILLPDGRSLGVDPGDVVRLD